MAAIGIKQQNIDTPAFLSRNLCLRGKNAFFIKYEPKR